MTRARRWWRLLLAVLLVRRFTPRPWERPPGLEDTGGPGDDTGGGGWYRPPHRRQDPAVDPREPNGGESSSVGNDHGWSGCTMSATAMALTYAKRGGTYWGGDMRHAQGDLSGGTDLYDARDAFDHYGESLGIRSGQGWDALKSDRAAGRFLVVQGSGNVPGSATFDGGHACALSPETNADGAWLFGDPLAGGWQWVTPGSIRTWMEDWAGSGLAWARTVAPPPEPVPPDPEPEPEPEPGGGPPGPTYAEGYQAGLVQGRAQGGQASRDATLDAVFRSWWERTPEPSTWPRWDRTPWGTGAWAVAPYPLVALGQASRDATWGDATWTGAAWRHEETPPEGGAWDDAAWALRWA